MLSMVVSSNYTKWLNEGPPSCVKVTVTFDDTSGRKVALLGHFFFNNVDFWSLFSR